MLKQLIYYTYCYIFLTGFMRKPIQLNRTIKIDEYEASIFYDGSIIVNTAEKDLCVLIFTI